MKHRSTFTILREQPEVRKQAGMALGALLAAFGLHTWSSSVLIAGRVPGLTAADAGVYAGAFSASVFLAAALAVGWICGGWILEAAADQDMETNAALRQTLRQLAVAGCLLIALMTLGAWPLAGGLIMVVGAGAGLIARNAIRVAHAG